MNATTVYEDKSVRKAGSNKRQLGTSAAVLLSALGVMSFGAQADHVTDTIANGIKESKTKLLLRYRYENVDQEGVSKTANASTLKTRLTFQTGQMWNVNFKLEFDNVSEIGNDSYNSTKNGKGQYPVVADPKGTDLNQAYIQWKSEGLKLTGGRQRIVHNDQRFIGGVAWRQNEQTYDGYRLQYGRNAWSVDYAYVHNVNRIFGPDNHVGPPADLGGDIHMFNLKYKFNKQHKLSVFAYGMDFDAAHALSNDTVGVLYNGKFGNFNLTASYAGQTDGGDNPNDFDTNYFNLAGNFKVGKVTLGAGYEELDGDNGVGFMTPLATLHKWQGFADQFLGTPGTGIEDLQFNIAGKVGPVKLKLVWHDFSASEGGGDYGDEIDLTAAYKINKHVSALLKYSDFNADSGSGRRDIEKLWIMLTAKF